ncbi:MAG: hypothetical protein R3E90_15160 [Marinicella sp.]
MSSTSLKIIFLILVSLQVSATNELENLQGDLTVITVGVDSTCDFNSIETALDSIPAGNTQTYSIRITNQQLWPGGLFIGNKNNLTLQGGYGNCVDAAAGLANGPNAVIDGQGESFPGITVHSQSSAIHLFKLTIQNFTTLGGVVFSDDSSGIISQTTISNNRRTLFDSVGGGLSVLSNSFVRVSNSLIDGNESFNGGGVACAHSTVEVINTTISNNKTVETGNDFANRGKGGGIYATDFCVLKIDNYITVSNQGTGFGKKIIHNTATIQGGGLFANGGSTVEINKAITSTTQDGQQVVFEDNQILHDVQFAVNGAGMAISGSGTTVDAYQLALYGNDIDASMLFGSGGGLFAGNGATFSMRINKSLNHCIQENIPSNACNQIQGNTVLNGVAAGFVTNSNAVVDIYQTDISGNVAQDAHLGSVFGAEVNMQGNVIHNNGLLFNPNTTQLIAASTGSVVNIDFSTIADNHLFSGPVISGFAADRIALTRSIIDENSNTPVFADNQQNPSNLTLFRCLLTHENSSFFGTTIVLGSADYVPGSTYRLEQGSLGLTMCNHNSADLFPENDIDGEFRTGCTGQICPPASFDAGADATFWFDVIFKDRFE